MKGPFILFGLLYKPLELPVWTARIVAQAEVVKPWAGCQYISNPGSADGSKFKVSEVSALCRI